MPQRAGSACKARGVLVVAGSGVGTSPHRRRDRSAGDFHPVVICGRDEKLQAELTAPPRHDPRLARRHARLGRGDVMVENAGGSPPTRRSPWVSGRDLLPARRPGRTTPREWPSSASPVRGRPRSCACVDRPVLQPRALAGSRSRTGSSWARDRRRVAEAAVRAPGSSSRSRCRGPAPIRVAAGTMLAFTGCSPRRPGHRRWGRCRRAAEAGARPRVPGVADRRRARQPQVRRVGPHARTAIIGAAVAGRSRNARSGCSWRAG